MISHTPCTCRKATSQEFKQRHCRRVTLRFVFTFETRGTVSTISIQQPDHSWVCAREIVLSLWAAHGREADVAKIFCLHCGLSKKFQEIQSTIQEDAPPAQHQSIQKEIPRSLHSFTNSNQYPLSKLPDLPFEMSATRKTNASNTEQETDSRGTLQKHVTEERVGQAI